jgi:hypothetical protein
VSKTHSVATDGEIGHPKRKCNRSLKGGFLSSLVDL